MAGRKNRRGWGHIRQLPNKGRKYQASYAWPPNTTSRHNAPCTFTTRALAERWLASEYGLIERGEWLPPKMRVYREVARAETFGSYAERWIEERPLKESSRREYLRMYESFMRDSLGHMPLHALDAATVRSWFAAMDTTPTRKFKTYGRLASIIATAVSDGLLVPNPCVLSVKKPQREITPGQLTTAEVALLAQNITPRFSALVLIGAWCGLRIGELIGLQRSDVGDDASTLTVARQVDHAGGCTITSLKQGQQHVVVIPPHVRADVKHHLDTFTGAEPTALLFPGSVSCHLSEGTVRNEFKKALKTIGRENVRVHDLKHFCGTMTARTGATLAESMQRLGHSTASASLIYQGVTDGRPEEIAAALSALAEAAPGDSHQNLI